MTAEEQELEQQALWKKLSDLASDLVDAGDRLHEAVANKRQPAMVFAIQYAMTAAFEAQRLLGRVDAQTPDHLDSARRK